MTFFTENYNDSTNTLTNNMIQKKIFLRKNKDGKRGKQATDIATEEKT